MGDALRVDELWEPTTNPDHNAAQHLETNKWLAPFIATASGRLSPRPGPVPIDFLGHTIFWTIDRDRPFPQWVADALVQMLEFAHLPANWNSYGGRPLQLGAVGPVLKLIIGIHRLGRQARLVPLPDGGVGIRISDQNRCLEIDVRAGGKAEAILEREGMDDIVIGPEAQLAEAEKLLSQFLA